MASTNRIASPETGIGSDTSRVTAEIGAFPVVGVGAGIGGVEAAAALLAHVPSDSGMAFVFVLHRDDGPAAELMSALASATSMPVVQAGPSTEMQPNHVYAATASAGVAVEHGLLRTNGRPVERRAIIDPFFRSLAHDAQSRAIGVILSGAGTDGAAGLCEVKAAGGITFAQDEGSAAVADMPRSAVGGGCADFVLSPDEIGRRLAELARRPELLPATRVPEADELYRSILRVVQSTVGVDFRDYRDTTIKRRIVRRLMLQGRTSLADYARHLEEDRDEAEALYRDLLINVTSFFREPDLFESLKRHAIPAILREKAPDQPIRVWVPGCSTGQEAYSLAMVLIECLDQQRIRRPIQIFATDLSDSVALATARSGVYPTAIEAEVTPERLRRFFHRDGDRYVVDRALRDPCVFAQHNVITDPPFIRLDLVSCRNVLIYMGRSLQERVLQTFHYALNTPGFLVLGASESPGVFADLFVPLERSEKIFSKKPSAGRVLPPRGHEGVSLLSTYALRPAGSGGQEMMREVDRFLLGRFAPAAVLVNDQFEVLQYRGRTGAFLEAPTGEPTVNILRLAREGLALELRRLLVDARSRNEVMRRPGVRVPEGGGAVVDLEVVPLRAPGTGERCFLVLFGERAAAFPAQDVLPLGDTGLPPPSAGTSLSETVRRLIAAWRHPPANPAAPVVTGSVSEDEHARILQELYATRESLQSLIEQQDAANEELRTANEEVLASNEELLSTNEELQGAKEELQSANEELTTVNEQTQQHNRDLAQANDDLANLLQNITIPVVIVGRDARIRRLTPAATNTLEVGTDVIGRPISHLHLLQNVPDLEGLLEDVLEHGREYEREVAGDRGTAFMLRMHPYHTTDGRADGAVIALVDITDLRRGEEAERRLAAIVASSEDAIIGKTLDGIITSWNQGAEHVYGYAAAEVIGLPVSVLVPFGHEDEFPRIVEQLRRGLRVRHFETVRRRKDGRLVDVSISYSPVHDANGQIVAAAVIARDISDSKEAVRRLQSSEARKAAILDTALDAIVSMDHQGRIIDFNRAAERMFGYPAGGALGRTVADLLITPELRTAHRQGLNHYLATGDARVLNRRREFPARRADGSIFPVEVAVTRIPAEEPPIFTAAIRDVTEQKRAEQRVRFQLGADAELAALVDYESTLQKIATLAVPDFADWCMVDMVEDGRLRRLAVAHADPEKVSLLAELSRRYPPDPNATQGPMAVLRGGAAAMATDLTDDVLMAAAHDDDHLRLLRTLGLRSYISVPLFVRGDIVGVVTFVLSDVSGRRYGPEDLRVAEDFGLRAGIAIDNARLYGELKESDRRKDEFLAMLSHELRNPLAPIRSAVDVLTLKDPPDNELRTARDVIDRQVRQMVRLVDDLLDISRITRGKIRLHRNPIEVRAILHSAVEGSRPVIEAAAHELRVEAPPHPLWVDADPVRLVQVLLNLLNNAAKFTPPGGRIWLAAAAEERGDGGPGTVRFTVRDTGVGIAAQALHSIFDMFAQGERTIDRSLGGLGVGLTLVRALVELHGGSVDARSDGEGQGSEFIVKLPAAPAPAAPTEADATPTRALGEGPTRRILVVDDNRDQAETLAALLGLAGHEVRLAFDGPQALKVLEDFVPDLALVDLGLPGMDGYELARHIRGRPGLEHVVLVAQTGWGQDEHRRRSRAAGFDDHLVKPIALEALEAVLARLDVSQAGASGD